MAFADDIPGFDWGNIEFNSIEERKRWFMEEMIKASRVPPEYFGKPISSYRMTIDIKAVKPSVSTAKPGTIQKR